MAEYPKFIYNDKKIKVMELYLAIALDILLFYLLFLLIQMNKKTA